MCGEIREEGGLNCFLWGDKGDLFAICREIRRGFDFFLWGDKGDANTYNSKIKWFIMFFIFFSFYSTNFS